MWTYQSYESNGISLKANTLQFSPSHVQMAILTELFNSFGSRFSVEIKATEKQFAKSAKEIESERKGIHVNLMFYVVSVMRGCEI